MSDKEYPAYDKALELARLVKAERKLRIRIENLESALMENLMWQKQVVDSLHE
jgi:hypothetical protein